MCIHSPILTLSGKCGTHAESSVNITIFNGILLANKKFDLLLQILMNVIIKMQAVIICVSMNRAPIIVNVMMATHLHLMLIHV